MTKEHMAEGEEEQNSRGCLAVGEVGTTVPLFPEPIRKLPEADIPLRGIKAFLSQADNHQIIFMEFAENVDLAEHSHAAQIGIVIAGKIDLKIDDEVKTYEKGCIYHIPSGVKHSGKIYAGYADITFFDEPDRYRQK